MDLDKYSALVASGGDGTYYEVVNGMLARPDKKRLPIGLIPNGSGNSLCYSIGIQNVDDALDYIVAGTAAKFDI